MRYGKRYMRDTCGIHAGYMLDKSICKGDQDTCEIHPRYIMRYMYLKCILRGTYLRCRIHAGYMPNTCGIHVTSEVIKIHAGYMRDTFGIHLGYMRNTYLGAWGNVAASRARDTYPQMYPYVSDTYRECILCVHVSEG